MFNFLKRIAASIQNPAADRKILFLDDADDKLKIKDSNGDLESFTLGEGTASEIAFFNTSNTLTSSSDLYWDSDNGRLGVGTDAPAKLIDVNGDALINGLTIGRGNSNVSNNTAIGKDALSSITTGNQSVGIGHEALKSATNTGLNTAVGYRALATLSAIHPSFPSTISNFSVAVGYAALEKTTTATDNTAVGYAAMRDNVTGDFNTAYGYAALGSLTTGRDNCGVGWRSLGGLTDGYSNVGIGYNNLGGSTSGYENSIVGYECFGGNGNPFYNSALGYRVARNGTGSRNVGVGWRALDVLTTGEWNTVIGAYAGGNMTDASRCTVIGANIALDSASAYSELYIGDGGGNVRIKHNGGRLKFPDFGSGTQTGTQVYNLQVTSNGSIVETKAIPTPPVSDGIYKLTATVTGGVATLTWEL